MIADLQRAIAFIRDGARRRGGVSVAFPESRNFHELIVTAAGDLAINAYAGEPALLATVLEELPEPVIDRLVAACIRPGQS